MNLNEKAEYVLKRLNDPGTKELVYDTETSGLDGKRGFVCGYVFTFGPAPEETVYIPVRHGGGANLGGWQAPETATWTDNPFPQHPFEVELAKAALRRDLHWIGHNIKFDLHFSANDTSKVMIVGTVEDTQVNQALINEFMPRFTLEECCKYFGIPGKKGEPLYKHLAETYGGEPKPSQMGNYWRLAGDDPIGVDYSIGDGIATWGLRARQLKQIEAEELTKVWGVERRVTRTLFRMERRGVRCSEDRLVYIGGVVKDRIASARKRLPEGINLRSSPQLVKLFNDNGITKFARTAPSGKFPDGQPSFTEEWLKTNELGEAIVAVRKYEHLRDSFLTPLHERHLWKGRVHTNYNQLRGDQFGAITGRLSSNDPNLQQIHKRNVELGRLFRSVFIPDDRMKIATADYVQCEPVLLAFYSRCQVLLDGFMADPPVDAHSAVAIAMFGDAEKGHRQSGKTMNQALITGAGIGEITRQLGAVGVDPYRAKEIYHEYFRLMPEIKTLQQQAKDRFRARGYVRSLLWRKARLEARDKDYKAMNRLLQCGNADILKLKLCEVDEYWESEGDRVHLLNSIHDDLVSQFHEEDRPVYEQGLRIMESFGSNDLITLDVPLRVDPKEGDNWAEATYGKELDV